MSTRCRFLAKRHASRPCYRNGTPRQSPAVHTSIYRRKWSGLHPHLDCLLYGMKQNVQGLQDLRSPLRSRSHSESVRNRKQKQIASSATELYSTGSESRCPHRSCMRKSPHHCHSGLPTLRGLQSLSRPVLLMYLCCQKERPHGRLYR